MAREESIDIFGAPSPGDVGSRCAASECMVWQWDEDSAPIHEDDTVGDATHGYCGLAGGPHAK